jgi:hypothetical protein
MDLLHLVDRLEELVGSAQKMPIGSRAIVDRRRILDIVDQMRVAVPQEVREAQEMVSHRDDVYREAEEEARLIVARAEERAARMVEQHELTIAARARAEEVAQQAEARIEERLAEANREIQQRIEDSRHVADQQMEAADDYARELLSRLEVQLQAFVRSVQSGISQLENAPRPASSGVDASATAEPAGDEREMPAMFGSAPAAGGIDDPGELARPYPEAGIEADPRARLDEEATPPPADPGVIDDFAMPQLDDEPSYASMFDQSDAADPTEGRDPDEGASPLIQP